MHNEIRLAGKTWNKKDGILMVDYSSQEPNSKPGSHICSIDTADFKKFLKESMPYDFDVMLETRDKGEKCYKSVKNSF